MIEICLPKMSATHREKHFHRCPIHNPRKDPVVEESNELCGKVLAGTGLEGHTFPCAIHAADIRRRFSSDWLVESFLEHDEAARLWKMWPDAATEEREQLEAQVNPAIKTVLDEADKI